MRADRLVSILLLLQMHGRLTARTLAERLEVSERTVERDMEALSIAGVPVFATRGRHGGWQLIDTYRTDLTGLTDEELRSLMAATTPRLIAGLGLGMPAERALIKLLATLPATRRQEAERARSYIHVDPTGWRRHEEVAPTLPELDRALRLDRRISFDYERMDGATAERVGDPLGLVAKGSVWYLVAAVDDQPRTYRASRIRDVRVLDEPIRRPGDFDLEGYWGRSRTDFEARLPAHFATLRVSPGALPWLDGGWLRYSRVVEVSDPEPDGRVRVRMRADSVEILQALALGVGSRGEVLDPEELRNFVLAEARAIAARAASERGGHHDSRSQSAR